MLKIFKKVLVLSLSAALLFSVTACGKSNTSDSTSSSTGTQAADPKDAIDKTKAKLVVWQSPNSGVVPADINATPFLDEIKKKTGYANIEWNVLPTSGALDKINLLMVSGAQVDILSIGDAGLYAKMVQQNQVNALDEYLNNYGAELKKGIAKEAWDTVTYKGKIYSVPIADHQILVDGTHVGAAVTMVRSDLMTKLNLQEPKTVDGIYEFLKAMKAGNPNIIPFTGYVGDASATWSSGIEGLVAPFGQAMPYSVKDGKIVANNIEPEAKECLTFLNKLYKEELLDKDFVTNKKANALEKIQSGKVAMFTTQIYDFLGIRTNLVKNDTNAKIATIRPLEGKLYKNGMPGISPVGYKLVVPKTAKFPKEAVDFMNTYWKDMDLRNYIEFGKEGEHYNVENGLKVAIPDKAKAVEYRIYYKLFNNTDAWRNNVKLKGFEADINDYAAKGNGVHDQVNILQIAPPFEKQVAVQPTLNDLTNQYFLKIIIGSLPISAFDEFVTKWKSTGGDDVLKEMNAWYQDTGKDTIKK